MGYLLSDTFHQRFQLSGSKLNALVCNLTQYVLDLDSFTFEYSKEKIVLNI